MNMEIADAHTTEVKKIESLLNVESVQYGAGMVEQLIDIFV